MRVVIGLGLVLGMLMWWAASGDRVKIDGFDAFESPSTSMEDIDTHNCSWPNPC